jgi:hypothetical protein
LIIAKPIASVAVRKDEMTNYRRNLVAGGSYFFTVNLAERRLRLLTQHVDMLRSAFRKVRARHPFTVEAIVILPDHPSIACCGSASIPKIGRAILRMTERSSPRDEAA